MRRRKVVPKSAGVPCQIIPHPLAQSASAPGSCKICYDSLFSTLRLAALIEWETEIRQAGEAVLFYLENDENNALRFSHGFAVDFETLKSFRRYNSDKSSHKVVVIFSIREISTFLLFRPQKTRSTWPSWHIWILSILKVN